MTDFILQNVPSFAAQTDIVCNNLGQPAVSTTTSVIASANQTRAIRFFLAGKVTISNIDISVATGLAGSKIGVGIYDSTRTTLLVDSGPIATDTNGVKTTSITQKPLNPGTYWFAYTCTDSATLRGICLPALTNDTGLSAADPGGGTCANASSAGQLPASLGAVTYTNIAPILTRFR